VLGIARSVDTLAVTARAEPAILGTIAIGESGRVADSAIGDAGVATDATVEASTRRTEGSRGVHVESQLDSSAIGHGKSVIDTPCAHECRTAIVDRARTERECARTEPGDVILRSRVGSALDDDR
jgi:hypothetical protein